MAGICISSSRVAGAGGRDYHDVSVELDGVQIATFRVNQARIDALPWTDAEKQLFVKLGLKLLRVRESLALDDLAGRVTNGEEGSNVKIWPLITKDITKTNIGTAYTNLPIGANGERKVVSFAGVTQIRIRMWTNHIGTGPWRYRLIRDSDNAVIYESPSITQTGERELDSDWFAKPVLNPVLNGDVAVRIQGKSDVAADDPVIRGCDLGTK